jgi:hypothetical protein
VVADLVQQLRNLQEPEIRLAHCLVRPQSATVCDLQTGERVRKIRASEVELLRYLLGRQESGQSEARSYDIKHDLKRIPSLGAAQKRLDRLGDALAEDLVIRRAGNQRYYRVRT